MQVYRRLPRQRAAGRCVSLGHLDSQHHRLAPLRAIAGTAARSGQPQLWQVAATSGICGAYTTFSTFMYETLQLMERRAWWDAIWNLTSLLAGVAAAAAGWLLATPLVG